QQTNQFGAVFIEYADDVVFAFHVPVSLSRFLLFASRLLRPRLMASGSSCRKSPFLNLSLCSIFPLFSISSKKCFILTSGPARRWEMNRVKAQDNTKPIPRYKARPL